MNNIAKKYLDIRYVDTLAEGDSPLHRLDPGAKLVTTLAFIVAVVSFGKYTVLGFIPFFLYPVVMISLGGLPAGYLLKKIQIMFIRIAALESLILLKLLMLIIPIEMMVKMIITTIQIELIFMIPGILLI